MIRRLGELGLNVNQAEMRAHLPQGYIRGVVRDDEKRAVPNIEKARRISEALGLEFYIGPPRDHDETSSPPVATEDDFARIPLHAAFLAAGDGAENGIEQIVDYLAFRRDWLRRIGVAPGNAALARVDGESMQPSIWHGDMVMVDRSQIEIPVRARTTESRHRSPVYALLEDGRARVKRLERPTDDQLVLISDNPEYAPQFVHPGTVSVIGKVVWWGHTARE